MDTPTMACNNDMGYDHKRYHLTCTLHFPLLPCYNHTRLPLAPHTLQYLLLNPSRWLIQVKRIAEIDKQWP